MKKKIKKLNFFEGEIYFLDEFDLKQKINFKKEFDKVEYNYSWHASRGTIIPNGQNERFKFDIIPPDDFYEGYFTGFLYSDGTILGKIKYLQEANATDTIISGQYEKLNKNRILVRGVWNDTKGLKEPVGGVKF